MNRRRLVDIRSSYGSRTVYDHITDIIWNRVEHKVRNVMEKNPEAVELQNLIKETEKIQFKKEEEMAFQIDYGFTDDSGEDYPDYRFSQDLYDNYVNFLKNYDEIIQACEERKKKIQEARFVFGRAKKLEQIEFEIKDKKRTYDYYMSIRKREEAYENWQKDKKNGEVFKEQKEKLAQIRKAIVENLVAECFDQFPELMMYDFTGMSFSKDVLKAIENEQNSRTLTTTKAEKKDKEKEEENQAGQMQ